MEKDRKINTRVIPAISLDAGGTVGQGLSQSGVSADVRHTF